MDDHQSALIRELDGYLLFFKRRQEIELDYVESLRKLSNRSTQPPESEHELHAQIPTTWRQSWFEVRSSLEDEANSHKMAAEGLDRLIQKLTHFRDDRDRIRRRIREDLRTTANEYAEYKQVVSRLRKTYERKVEELANHEEAEHLKEVHEREKESTSTGMRSPGATSDPGGWPPEHWTSASTTETGGHFLPAKTRNRSDSSASSGKGGSSDTFDHEHSSYGSPPHTSVFVSGATSSSGSAPSAYRDPPTAKQNVFEAIAKRDWSNEKHRVNSIVRAVGSLAKGNDPATALNPNRGVRSRQYGGKLKREAEEADRQYRASIFQLETLRLQKQRVQASARESLREFVTEMATSIKSTLDQRLADQLSIGYAGIAIADHIRPAVERIDANKDVENYFSAVRDEAPQDQPVYYINAFIGECRSLLFGVGLQDYCANHPGLLVPIIVQRCIAKVEESGLDFEGIYRVPGKLATIQQYVHQMEKEEETFRFGENDDVSAVAGVLKLYLRQLPIALFPFSTADRKSFASEYASSPDTAIAALVRRIRRLSPPQQATLKAVCQHLARVADHESLNKMSASNLGLIFSTVVFGEEEGATLETLQNSKDSTMELLIKQHVHIFEGLPLEQPPLVRSRAPSGNLDQAVRPQSSQSHNVATVISPSTSPAPSSSRSSNQNPTQSRTSNSRRSVESVYALYQDASLGLLPSEPSPQNLPASPPSHLLPTSTSTPNANLNTSRSSAIPIHPAAGPRHHASPLRSSSGSSEPPRLQAVSPTLPARPEENPRASVHDLSTPSPPLSAALGRHIPSSSTSSLL
ncbi:uncharacterized protein JCM6883_000345 [Sporobolomyces salmoneus]|uniref:uncharacterized protein n=1 Tax=Sporobolomyces salmoneus TaxID=183962 RepID=UPI0031771497